MGDLWSRGISVEQVRNSFPSITAGGNTYFPNIPEARRSPTMRSGNSPPDDDDEPVGDPSVHAAQHNAHGMESDHHAVFEQQPVLHP
ncbi:MAG: hypothetical protein IPP80_00400 [Ignavibacteria bacterium]|nr:hypothetical protein [Ignavibacteria bacterium]